MICSQEGVCPIWTNAPLEAVRDSATSLAKGIHLVLGPWVPLPSPLQCCLQTSVNAVNFVYLHPLSHPSLLWELASLQIWVGNLFLGWLMIDLKQPVYSLSQKLVSKLLCDPGPQGNTKRTFSSFLLLRFGCVNSLTAILHVFIRGGVADTLGLANWKDEEEPGPWWHCWVPCWGLWPFPQQPCLGIKYMLREGARKEGL